MDDGIQTVLVIQGKTTPEAYPNATIFTREGGEIVMRIVHGLDEALALLAAKRGATSRQRYEDAVRLVRSGLLAPRPSHPPVEVAGWIAEYCCDAVLDFMPFADRLKGEIGLLQPRNDAFLLPVESGAPQPAMAIFRDQAGYHGEAFHSKGQGFDLIKRFGQVLSQEEEEFMVEGVLACALPPTSSKAADRFGGIGAALVGTALYLPKQIKARYGNILDPDKIGKA